MRVIKDDQTGLYKREITVRPACVRDAEALAGLARELAESEGGRTVTTARSVTQDMLGEGSAMRVLVAESGKKVVGFVLFYPGYDLESATHGFHLADLAVTEDWRGQGVGTRLMAEVSRAVLAADGAWLSWTVLKKNHAAREFYISLGAEAVDVNFMAMGRSALGNMI